VRVGAEQESHALWPALLQPELVRGRGRVRVRVRVRVEG